MSGKGSPEAQRKVSDNNRHEEENCKRKLDGNEEEEEEDRREEGGVGSKRPKNIFAGLAPKNEGKGCAPISMKLGLSQGKESALNPKKSAASGRLVANVFGADDDDEEETMPPEAKMRMRNMGRDTPTSTGPNSFGKTRQGFCDSRKGFEKKGKTTSGLNEDDGEGTEEEWRCRSKHLACLLNGTGR